MERRGTKWGERAGGRETRISCRRARPAANCEMKRGEGRGGEGDAE